MKTFKRTLSLLFAIILFAIVFSGCNKEETTEIPKKATEISNTSMVVDVSELNTSSFDHIITSSREQEDLKQFFIETIKNYNGPDTFEVHISEVFLGSSYDEMDNYAKKYSTKSNLGTEEQFILWLAVRVKNNSDDFCDTAEDPFLCSIALKEENDGYHVYAGGCDCNVNGWHYKGISFIRHDIHPDKHAHNWMSFVVTEL